MKKYMIAFALMILGVSLQIHAQTEPNPKEMQEDLQQVLKPTYEDYYEGLTKKITFDRMIPPYGLEVTFDKTVHIIFPAAIRYVDLGSNIIVAGKAGSSENVLRVKASVRQFETETNMAVITEEGSYYTFNIKYMPMSLKS